MGNLTFNPANWPEPKAMVDTLKSYGTKIMVSTWPFSQVNETGSVFMCPPPRSASHWSFGVCVFLPVFFVPAPYFLEFWRSLCFLILMLSVWACLGITYLPTPTPVHIRASPKRSSRYSSTATPFTPTTPQLIL